MKLRNQQIIRKAVEDAIVECGRKFPAYTIGDEPIQQEIFKTIMTKLNDIVEEW